MTYHILHDFRASTSFQEKSSDYFKDLYKLKLLTNFEINLASSLTCNILKERPYPIFSKGQKIDENILHCYILYPKCIMNIS